VAVRILVVGAGATGGYFGGRLLEAGRDVTFLVRPGRAAQLARDGLVISSRFGDVALPPPPTLLAGEAGGPFDVVLLSCKSYDLEAAAGAVAPAVGPDTMILPLLNGMRHLDVLDAKFGARRVLGGMCLISARLGPSGQIVHLNDAHRLAFGERPGGLSERVSALAGVMANCRFDARASESILLEMWEKWVFLAALAGLTCLMRAAVGDVVAAGGADLGAALLEECRAVAAASGWPPRQHFLERARGQLTEAGSTLTASMLGDVERGGRTEADHVLGDLLRRGEGVGAQAPLLRLAYTGLKACEARSARESATGLDRPAP
jgi:2-dehydropantoate 2-reductase